MRVDRHIPTSIRLNVGHVALALVELPDNGPLELSWCLHLDAHDGLEDA
eukprot:CAMPEP_0119421098 /NCGR_PEP_ID=MMETSP1335-20130426/25085_1 /TAXON_ID=259385 /ORGANISM="Chrysoculter rhomboideus, Strain RCC1486" /LENGTH=48 /DNA_ID= /DNA_START= /DNA_END= /DNA_ORIENTATION=